MSESSSPRRSRSSFTPPLDAIAFRDYARPYPRSGGAREGKLTPLIPAITVRAYIFRPVQAPGFKMEGDE